MSTQVQGQLKVSNDVLCDLAGYAALGCYGVVGMAGLDSQDSMVRLLPSWRLRKGIELSQDGPKLSMDVHVILERGVNVSSVCENLVSAIRFVLKSLAVIDAIDIRIHVEGLRA